MTAGTRARLARRLPSQASRLPDPRTGRPRRGRSSLGDDHRRLRPGACLPISSTWVTPPPRNGPSGTRPPGRSVFWGPVGAVVGLLAVLFGLLTQAPGVRLLVNGIAEDVGRTLLSGPPRSILGNLP